MVPIVRPRGVFFLTLSVPGRRVGGRTGVWLAYAICLPALYGGLGWLADHRLGTAFWLPLGIVLGAAFLLGLGARLDEPAVAVRILAAFDRLIGDVVAGVMDTPEGWVEEPVSQTVCSSPYLPC